jgi:hypothetical protein
MRKRGTIMQGVAKIEKLLVTLTYPDEETTKVNVFLVGEGQTDPQIPEGAAEVWDLVPMIAKKGFRLFATPVDSVDFFS